MSYLELVLEQKLLDKYSENQQSEIIVGLQEILKVLIDKTLKVQLEYVDVLKREEYYIFTPFTVDSLLFSKDSKEFLDFISHFDFKYFIGYTLLSDSGLSRYLIEKWVEQGDYNLSDLKIRYYHVPEGYITLIPIFNSFTRDVIDRFDINLSRLIKEGYFSYFFSIHELENLEVIKELCLLYDITIVFSKDLSNMICKTDVDFGITPEKWLRDNLSLIRLGQFPNFTFSFDFSFYNDYIRLYGEQFKDVILEYITYLAYAKLSDKYPLISPSITSIRINENLSITVALPSYSLVKMLKFDIEKHLDIRKENTKATGVYNIEICSDLREGIIKRWIVQKTDNDAYPMIFRNKSGIEILIHRSTLAIKYPSPFQFGKEEIEKAENELVVKFKDFYSTRKICHDGIELVSMENINTMNLYDLLRLIPIEEKGITYCFTNETITRLVKKENPLTRRPLSEKTLRTEKNLERGWRGLFDVGVLFGLYSEIPHKILIPVKIGVPRVLEIFVDKQRKELVGHIFLIEILFEDGTSSPLFEISLPKSGTEIINELREYVHKLWNKGYFLTSWTSAIVQHLNVKSFSTIINDPILLSAANSIFDGNVALKHLKEALTS